jgi:hypothetical protein
VWRACLEVEALVVQKPDSTEVNSAASGGVVAATRVTPGAIKERTQLACLADHFKGDKQQRQQ